MKKQLYIYIASFMIGLYSPLVWAQTPVDIVYHGAPPTTTFDIPEEVTQISSNLQSSQNELNKMATQAQADLTLVQTTVTDAFNSLKSGAIGDFIGDGGDGTTFCGKKLKNVDVEDMADKVKEILLTYKSQKIADTNKQKEMRDKFYLESAYVIYAAAEKLEGQLKDDIAASISKAKTCAEEGDGAQCNIPSSAEGGNNDGLFTYGQTLKTLESVIRVWENVAALKAQLRAIKSIMTITPQVKTSEETAANIGLSLPPVILRQRESYAFAQLSYNSVSSSLSNIETEIISDDSEGEQLIKSTIEFASPAEADNEHPLIAAENKIEAYNNLRPIEDMVTEAMNIHNMIGSLYDYKQIADQIVTMQTDYESSFQKLQTSEQCSINYLSKYFSDPVKVWSGLSLGDYVNKHDLRSGISAWAIEAYETAKAAETSVITTEDIAQISFDTDTQAQLEDDPDMSKAAQVGQSFNVSLNISKQEDAQEETRKSALLGWQIGAEASKMLGSNASDWGSPLPNTMVWTDTKNFYNQYLRRKYDNIKSYLKSYTKEDILAFIISKFRGDEQDISETKYQQALQKARDDATDEISSINSGQTSQYDDTTQETLNDLQKKRDLLVEQMDELNNLISKNSNEISDIRSVAEQNAADEIDSIVNAKVVYPTNGSTVVETSVKDKILGADELSASISSAKEAGIDNQKISSLEEAISANKTKLDEYNVQLEEIDKQISAIKLQAQSNAGLKSNQLAASISAAKEKWNQTINGEAQDYTQSVYKNLESIFNEIGEKNPLIYAEGIELRISQSTQAAEEALNNLYSQVDKVVDSGYNQLISLGNALYDPSSYPKIQAIHNDMIDQIRALTLSYSVSGFMQLNDILVYSKLLSVDTSPEEEGFFVGSPAKARDLKAPYAIPNFDLPPVREVFHFDGTDFANVKPVVQGNSDRSITASDFLNYGGDIPLIWQYILRDKAFIESDINLKELLDYGCVDIAFLRGGIMPCLVRGTSIILDVSSNGDYIIRNDIDEKNIPNCMLIDVDNNLPHHMVFDAPVRIISTGDIQPASKDCQYSELGMLLTSDNNNNLQIRSKAFEVFNNMLSESDVTDIDDNQKNVISLGNQAVLSHNQIGDFLYFMENEKVLRENLEEYQQRYNQNMATLKEKLSLYGFTPTESFDLTKDADYELALKKLKSIKEEKISEIQTSLSTIDSTDNEPVKEKMDNINKILSIMQKDTEGLLKMTTTIVNDNNIEAKLKKAEADQAVVDKYKNNLKEEYKDYTNIEDPYCANY